MKPILEYLYNRKGAIRHAGKFGILDNYDIIRTMDSRLWLVIIDEDILSEFYPNGLPPYDMSRGAILYYIDSKPRRAPNFMPLSDFDPKTLLKTNGHHKYDIIEVYRNHKNDKKKL